MQQVFSPPEFNRFVSLFKLVYFTCFSFYYGIMYWLLYFVQMSSCSW